MKKIVLFSTLIIFWMLCLCSGSSAAVIYTVQPSDDGVIYSTGFVYTSGYLAPYTYGRGVAEFLMPSIPRSNLSASLSLNPYGLPLWDLTVDVYGYESYDGILTFADYNGGNFLGTMVLPEDLQYGQDASFDVTDFITGTSAPYVGFNLRTEGSDQFSSLEYNYGHPAQLKLTTVVPEPATMALFGIGGVVMLFIRKKGKGNR